MAASIGAQAGELVLESKPVRTHLIELYTSEGCSSCLPAEAWMSGLKNQPRLWQEFVPVAFHVDYWDHLGWRDPFSSRSWTQRQMTYVKQMKLSSAYTPQVVVGGQRQFTGSRPDVLEQSIVAASQTPAIGCMEHRLTSHRSTKARGGGYRMISTMKLAMT